MRLVIAVVLAVLLLSACKSDSSDLAHCKIGNGSLTSALLYDPTGSNVYEEDGIYYRYDCVVAAI